MSLNMVDIVTLISGVASLVLALVAISLSRTAERYARENFIQTQSMMQEQYDKTKDVLSQIDKRAAVTERTVADTQEKLLTTMTTIFSKLATPANSDEQMGTMFMQMLLQDPDRMAQVIETMAPFVDLGQESGDQLAVTADQ